MTTALRYVICMHRYISVQAFLSFFNGTGNQIAELAFPTFPPPMQPSVVGRLHCQRMKWPAIPCLTDPSQARVSPRSNLSTTLPLPLFAVRRLWHAKPLDRPPNSKKREETYEWNHTSDDFEYSLQTLSSHHFVVGQLSAKSKVTKPKKLDVLMVVVISLCLASVSPVCNLDRECPP